MHPRRRFLVGALGAGALAACGGSKPPPMAPVGRGAGNEPKEEVTPAEDLMREHGLLNRVILVYEEAARRLDAGDQLPWPALGRAAIIVKKFVEDYHEHLEEDHLFPAFERAKRLTDLVKVLRDQHDAGRRITKELIRVLESPDPASERIALVAGLRSFTRMYRPHEAFEDTVLFPALHEVFTPAQLADLGDKFEEKEHLLFGDHGFERMVGEVSGIEAELGIGDLAKFTPAT